MEQLRLYYEEILEVRMDELKRRSLWLSKSMERLAEKIEAHGVETSINSCGECQSEPRIIDDLCKEIGHIRQTLEMIKGYSSMETQKKPKGRRI